jgi:oxygen-independent coproporphyrinogen-3 oxidase
MVALAVERLRGAGIHAINLDLMYGLPGQSLDDVRSSAARAISLAPSRLAVFGYAHVPWMKKNQTQIDATALPGAAARIAQAQAAQEVIRAAGYETIGLDHYARPDDDLALAARAGTLRRNFQGYTIDAAPALIPLGVSAIGLLPGGYIQNASDRHTWQRAIEAGELSVVRGLTLSAQDRARAAVIERLMCDGAADFGALAEAFCADSAALDDALPHLAALEADGLITREGRHVRVRDEARPFVRLVAAAFDAYLQAANAGRHSVAV